jgi:hypothetical protein
LNLPPDLRESLLAEVRQQQRQAGRDHHIHDEKDFAICLRIDDCHTIIPTLLSNKWPTHHPQ